MHNGDDDEFEDDFDCVDNNEYDDKGDGYDNEVNDSNFYDGHDRNHKVEKD